MKGSLNLGKIAGIGIFIHWTFVILIAFIVYSNYRAGHDTEQILWSVLFVLSIFVTVFLHELGHAMAAKRYRIQTRDITLLPIGGMARLERIPEKPSEELVVALAGPMVNIALAILTFFLIEIPSSEDFVMSLSGGVNAGNFFLNFFVVNIWLSLFNLLPAFPMDGGRVLRAILSMSIPRHKATEIAARIGQILAIGFVILGFYSNPFLIFIGLFIILGAQGEMEHTKTGHLLKGIITRDVMMQNIESLNEQDTIEQAVQKLLNGTCKNFLVKNGDIPTGTLSREEMIGALQTKGNKISVQEVMNRTLLVFDSNEPIDKLYRAMLESKNQLALVYEQEQFVGAVDMENILEYLMVKGALTKRNA